MIPKPTLLPIEPDQRAARFVRLLTGLVLFGIGLSFLFAADLGLPPWDVFHEGLADQIDWPVGRTINVVGLGLLLVMVALREPMGVGTLANIVVIGVVIDVFLGVVGEPEALWVRWAMVLSGPAIVALGSGFYIGSKLGPGPRDGIMTALGRRGVAIWKARTAIEAVAFFGGLALGGTAGFGTVWFLVTIGPLVDRALKVLSVERVAAN